MALTEVSRVIAEMRELQTRCAGLDRTFRESSAMYHRAYVEFAAATGALRDRVEALEKIIAAS